MTFHERTKDQMLPATAPISFAGLDPLTVALVVGVVVIALLAIGFVMNPADKTDAPEDTVLEGVDDPEGRAKE